MSTTEFVITCAGRDGSHLLLYSLGAHSAVDVVNEPLGAAGIDQGWLDECASGREPLDRKVFYPRDGVSAVGFPLQAYNARQPPFDDAREYLRSRDVRVIHLERRNWLRRTLSLWLAEQTDVWSDRDGTQPTVERIEVDIERLFAAFDELQTLYAQNRADFAGLDSLDVWYEELCNDYEAQMARVFGFLRLDAEPVRPQTHRQEQRALPDIICNYAQVAQALTGTRFEWMLEKGLGLESRRFGVKSSG